MTTLETNEMHLALVQTNKYDSKKKQEAHKHRREILSEIQKDVSIFKNKSYESEIIIQKIKVWHEITK